VIFEAGDACQKARSNDPRKPVISWGGGADLSLGQNGRVPRTAAKADAAQPLEAPIREASPKLGGAATQLDRTLAF